MRDPYNNAQIRFERTDRTGRFHRIEVEQEGRISWAAVAYWLVMSAAALVLAVQWWKP